MWWIQVLSWTNGNLFEGGEAALFPKARARLKAWPSASQNHLLLNRILFARTLG